MIRTDKELEEIIWRREVFLFGGHIEWRKKKRKYLEGGTYFFVEEKKRRRKRRRTFGEEKSLSCLGKKMMAKVVTGKRLVPNGSDKSHQVLPVARLVLIKPESPLAVKRVLHHHVIQLNL